MMTESDKEQTKREILSSARRVLNWRRLTVFRQGGRWIVEQQKTNGSGQTWEVVSRANEPNCFWFLKIFQNKRR